MRVNIYAEELTDKIEVISKEIEGHTYNAVRFYLELPVTVQACDCEELGKNCPTKNISGPFYHRSRDDDSAAVTFWGRTQLRDLFIKAITALDDFEKGVKE